MATRPVDRVLWQAEKRAAEMEAQEETNRAARESPLARPGTPVIWRPRWLVPGKLKEQVKKQVKRGMSGRSLWGPVLARATGIGCVLVGVAWLGEQAREETTYGRRLAAVPGREMSKTDTGQVVDEPLVRAAKATSENAPKEAAGSGGEAPPVEPKPCDEEQEQRPKGITEDGRVILNESNAEELMTLKGVGEKRAADIVELRDRLGEFRKVSDLLRIRGIGWKTLRRLREQVVVDRPLPPEPEEEPKEPAKAAKEPS